MSPQLLQRTLVVFILSTVVGLLMLPLASTDWAEATRQKHAGPADSGPESSEQREAPPQALMLVLPFVKVGVLMGVPAALVLGGGALVRRLRRS